MRRWEVEVGTLSISCCCLNSRNGGLPYQCLLKAVSDTCMEEQSSVWLYHHNLIHHHFDVCMRGTLFFLVLFQRMYHQQHGTMQWWWSPMPSNIMGWDSLPSSIIPSTLLYFPILNTILLVTYISSLSFFCISLQSHITSQFPISNHVHFHCFSPKQNISQSSFFFY